MSCFLCFSTVDTSLSKKKFSSHNDLTYINVGSYIGIEGGILKPILITSIRFHIFSTTDSFLKRQFKNNLSQKIPINITTLSIYLILPRLHSSYTMLRSAHHCKCARSFIRLWMGGGSKVDLPDVCSPVRHIVFFTFTFNFFCLYTT